MRFGENCIEMIVIRITQIKLYLKKNIKIKKFIVKIKNNKNINFVFKSVLGDVNKRLVRMLINNKITP